MVCHTWKFWKLHLMIENLEWNFSLHPCTKHGLINYSIWNYQFRIINRLVLYDKPNGYRPYKKLKNWTLVGIVNSVCDNLLHNCIFFRLHHFLWFDKQFTWIPYKNNVVNRSLVLTFLKFYHYSDRAWMWIFRTN